MTKKQHADQRHVFWVGHLKLGAEEDLVRALEEGDVGTTVLVALRKRATGYEGPIAIEIRQTRGFGLCVTVVDSKFIPIEAMKHFNLPVESLDYPFLTDGWLDAHCSEDYERVHAVELHRALRWARDQQRDSVQPTDNRPRHDQFGHPRDERGHRVGRPDQPVRHDSGARDKGQRRDDHRGNRRDDGGGDKGPRRRTPRAARARVRRR